MGLLLPPTVHLFHQTCASTLPPVFALLLKRVPQGSKRECRRTMPAIFGNHSDLSYPQRSPVISSNTHGSKAVLAQPKMGRCIGPSSRSRAEISRHQSHTISHN
ncbi:hypothetical protein PBY51_004986 [Eleginops maclovinus]|uniref:Uncharacterized protein n=1 Tax=Eleginops maclovinus TaxID=56733 RepID=A0AAN8AGZ4_ELEMC|nr:hypothetical protein PBY51_004986 [Eleginops maclovinus]